MSIACKTCNIDQYSEPLREDNIYSFYQELNQSGLDPVVNKLLSIKEQYQLDDWLYYQLIRKVSQQLSPKEKNYISYTLYKWYLLNKSGYDATLKISDKKILFYIQSDEIIYNIPYHIIDNKQYVCLNYHDYGNNIDFETEKFFDVPIAFAGSRKPFSYTISQIPDFNTNDYIEKDLAFNYSEKTYHFRVKLNPDIKSIFTNYPVSDYDKHFNIPLSKETYNSLIPPLRDIVGKMSTPNGIDYLMHFTRYAFLYERDTDAFGREKRFSPEETLLYDHSDCEDRAALFFYLVKEIYNLPMIVLAYPQHVSIAIEFKKPIGETIVYNGKRYTVCEPTPQRRDLKVGKQMPELRKTPYEVAYEYQPIRSFSDDLKKLNR